MNVPNDVGLPKGVEALLAIDRNLTSLEKMLNLDGQDMGQCAGYGEIVPIIASRLAAISQEIQSFFCAAT